MPSAHDPDYDPANFVHDHPYDVKLQEALKAARDLSDSITPRLPNETEVEASKRIDQEFAQLAIAIDKELDKHHESERSGLKIDFMREREAEMRAATLKGIENARLHELKIGGTFALDDQIRSFRDGINGNEQLKTQMQQLVNYQAARSEAISHAIKYTPPLIPEREVEPAPGEPPTPEPPEAKRLKGESAENQEGVQEQTASHNEAAEQHAPTPKYTRFKGENAEQFDARLTRLEARAKREEEREKEQPKPELHLRPSGPSFGR